MRDFASPEIFAALAAELTLDSKPGRAADGIYLEINSFAAEVNWAALVAWRFTWGIARIVVLNRARVRIEESIMIRGLYYSTVCKSGNRIGAERRQRNTPTAAELAFMKTVQKLISRLRHRLLPLRRHLATAG
jgi:hypothetical protein